MQLTNVLQSNVFRVSRINRNALHIIFQYSSSAWLMKKKKNLRSLEGNIAIPKYSFFLPPKITLLEISK